MNRRRSALILAGLALCGSLTACRSANGDGTGTFHPLTPWKDLPSPPPAATRVTGDSDGGIYVDQTCPDEHGQWSPHHVLQCKNVGFLGGTDWRWAR